MRTGTDEFSFRGTILGVDITLLEELEESLESQQRWGIVRFRSGWFDNYLIFYKWQGNEVVLSRLIHCATDLLKLLKDKY